MTPLSQISSLSTMKRSLASAALGASAVLVALAGPAEIARAALPTTRVDGTTVTITKMDSHNWSRLSPTNADTTKLKDGSRGEVWTFDVEPGQCFEVTMRSDTFSPYLSLRKGAPFGQELANDDAKGDNWVKISGTPGSAGPYYVMATSSGSGEKAGAYTLDIESCGNAGGPRGNGGSGSGGGTGSGSGGSGSGNGGSVSGIGRM